MPKRRVREEHLGASWAYQAKTGETVEFELGTGKRIRVRLEGGRLIVRAVGDYDRLVVQPESTNAISLECWR